MIIEITKEEAETGFIQLGARLDILNQMIIENADNPRRVKEIVEGMKYIESLKYKLMNAYASSKKEEIPSDYLRAIYLVR